MTERQIVLLNKMIEACINCGGDPGGPYWMDFASSFHDNLAVQYIPHKEFRIYKVEREE